MKVTELRKLLNNTNEEVLKKAIVEVYKLVPTGKKQDADFIIENVLSGNLIKKAKPVEKIDYSKLSDEINLFLENAYAQNYYAPNKAVPKKERSKWRFHVKRFVKELDKVPFDAEFYNEAVALLTKIYRMMCYACDYYLFSSEDTFQSVGISQYDFYKLVVEKTLAKGFTDETITTLLICAATGGLSRTSLHIEQEMHLLYCLKTNDVLKKAISKSKELIESTTNKYVKENGYSSRSFFLEREIHNFCDVILMAEIKLGEFKEGLVYYFDHVKERDLEVSLYCALDLIDMYTEDDDLWIKCYEYAVKCKDVDPREYLKESYKKKSKK